MISLRFFGAAAGVATALVLASACRDATQIVVVVSTNAECVDVKGTTVSTGVLGDALEVKPPSTASTDCESGTREIGSVVLVPSADSDAELGIRVVTGILRSADSCTAPLYAGCIVARRALRFQPHTSQQVLVQMDLSCLDVPCGALQTCVSGSCLPVDCAPNDTRAECQPSADGGQSVADAEVADASAPDADGAGPSSTACLTRDACAPTEECSPTSFTCVPDREGPRLLGAYELAPGNVRLELSEPVEEAAGDPSGYCIKEFSSSDNECAVSAFPIQSAVLAPGRRSVDLDVPGLLPNRIYLVRATRLFDASGQRAGVQSYASFRSGESFLRIVSAEAISPTSVELVFSRAPVSGTNAPSSAECEGAAECARRYRLVGPTDLGDATRAQLVADAQGNRVRLEHSMAQGGGAYTVIFANGRDGDGFDDAAFGSLAPRDVPGGGAGQNPIDRAVFFGLGQARVLAPSNGPLFVDPFGDGTPVGTLFQYHGAVYLGAGAGGRGAVRFRADGARPEVTSFFVHKDVTNPSQSSNTLDVAANAGFHLYLGAPGCFENGAASGTATPCGPDNENGRVRFAAGTLGGDEWLFAVGSRSSGDLDYMYATSDQDAFLHFKYVDMSAGANVTSSSASALGFFGGRLYAGLADQGPGTRPTLVAVQQQPAGDGLEPSTGGAVCLPSHGLCDLRVSSLRLGNTGTPANTAAPAGIDALWPFGEPALLYVGNNGGLVRSTPGAEVDATGWLDVTPSAPAYLAKTSVVLSTPSSVLPSDKAWPQLATYQGRLYAGRNTTAGPQLWACDPATGGAPGACDAGDWRLVAPNQSGDAQLTQLNRPGHQRIALLVASGAHLYLGYEGSDGVALYRSAAARPAAIGDFAGEGGCNAADAGCAPLGGRGLGSPVSTRIFDAAAAPLGDRTYLYVLAGTGALPLRVFRMQD